MKRMEKGTLKRTWTGLKPFFMKQRGIFFITFICALLVALSTLLVPVALGRAINAFENGAGAVNSEEVLKQVVIALVAIAVLLPAQYGLNVLNNRLAYGLVASVRNAAMARIEHLPLSWIDSRTSGDLLSRIIADMDTLQDGLLMLMTQALPGGFTILGAIIMMAILNWKIMLIVLLLTPASFLLTRLFAHLTYRKFRLQSELRGEETAYLDEMVTNQKIIQAYGATEAKADAFAELDTRLARASQDATFISSLLNPGTRFLKNVIYALVALVGATMVAHGSLEIGTLATFFAYTGIYMKPINEITGVITELQNAIVCAGRINDVITAPLERETGTMNITSVKGDVTFKSVSFRYEEDHPLIEDWTVSAKAGSRIALVGPTGCGKTTIINLIMRFYDPLHGSITLDGVNTLEMTRSSLRKVIGMVLQDTWLKDGTIFENVAFGKPDATREEVEEACRKAHCDGFITRLAKGYDTKIGEGGSMLSQGERQLLSIARLMLIVPPILILDEATSSIDTRTEMLIQDAFASLMKGRTAFIVAHRLQTIRDADMIVVMKDGRIVERGTHKELLAQDGFYQQLWNAQFE